MEKKFCNDDIYSHIFSQDISHFILSVPSLNTHMTPSWLSKNIYLSILLQN